MDLTHQQRLRIITLYQDGKLPQREISRRINVSKSAVNRVVKRYNDTGLTDSLKKGKCGRKRASTTKDNRMILRASLINPRLTAQGLKTKVDSHLSVRTIRRRLIEGGRLPYKPIKKPLLTEAAKKKRLIWGMCHRHWTADDWAKVKVI